MYLALGFHLYGLVVALFARHMQLDQQMYAAPSSHSFT